MILYIIYNESGGKYYIGTTTDLKRRLIEHNGKNSHYTGKILGTWIIKAEAQKEEKRLKKAKNKKYLEWYISSMGR